MPRRRHVGTPRATASRAAAVALAAGVVFAPALATTRAAAQEMGQGQAHITARSDVQMGIESGPGTSGHRLQVLGQDAGTQLNDIRHCYAVVVAKRPTVEGEMKIDLTVPEHGHVQVEVTKDDPNDGELRRCIVRALQHGHYDDVTRPANAFVTVTVRNTAAMGAARTAQRRNHEDAVAVQHAADGRLQSTGHIAGGKVSWTVSAEAAAGEPLVGGAQHGPRSGADPARLPAPCLAARPIAGGRHHGGPAHRAQRPRPHAHGVETVHDTRASRCVEHALSARHYGAARRRVSRV